MQRLCHASGGALAAAFAVSAYAGTPLDAEGEVGKTSYRKLPFQSEVYGPSWGASGGLAVSNLFWPATATFNDPQVMAQARQAAGQMEAQGLVPAGGAQLWEDVYPNSFPPGTFKAPGTPGYIAGAYNKLPEHRAWVEWVQARPQLLDVANDGGSMPINFRPWGGTWGHISPLTPMDAADCPTGMKDCSFGDWYAFRWGQTAKLSGGYGIMLSDFSDSQPSMPSTIHDFNPRIVAAFAHWLGRPVPGDAVSAQAQAILADDFNAWNDFLGIGYAKFFRALAARLGSNTGRAGLVIDQCGNWPGYNRMVGADQRIVAQQMPVGSYLCIWDDQSMQVGRSGAPMIWGIGGMVIAAAREPSTRNGGNLSADDKAFWTAVAAFYPKLPAAEQQERGLKELKRAWLETAWAHIATRTGTVRRALSFMSRDYWDQGKLDSKVAGLIQSIVPTRPFGPALYYSTAVERAQETAITHGGYPLQAYLDPNHLVAFKQGGGVVGYYVSDAALPTLKPGSDAAPSAWIVLDAGNDLPPTEAAALTAIAPIVTALPDALALPDAPLSFSTPSLTGTGFYDQRNRIIVTATNPGDTAVDGVMRLTRLGDGPHNLLDLFAGTTTQFTAKNGAASIPLAVQRWDTRAFAIL
jgi:hypothetical protein